MFEIGLRFRAAKQQPVVAGLAYGALNQEQWSAPKNLVDFYDVKADIETLVNAEFKAATHPALHPGKCAQILKDNVVIGYLGVLHPNIAQEFGKA